MVGILFVLKHRIQESVNLVELRNILFECPIWFVGGGDEETTPFANDAIRVFPYICGATDFVSRWLRPVWVRVP
jgi:hypothetical protein